MDDKAPNKAESIGDSSPVAEGGQPLSYQTGYGRPPKSGQFKPGQSGNPKGRKRKPKSVADQVRTELGRKVTVTESGVRKTIALQTVMLRTIAANAAKGDLRSASFLYGLADRPEEQTSDTIDPETLNADDRAIMDEFLARHLDDQSQAKVPVRVVTKAEPSAETPDEHSEKTTAAGNDREAGSDPTSEEKPSLPNGGPNTQTGFQDD